MRVQGQVARVVLSLQIVPSAGCAIRPITPVIHPVNRGLSHQHRRPWAGRSVGIGPPGTGAGFPQATGRPVSRGGCRGGGARGVQWVPGFGVQGFRVFSVGSLMKSHEKLRKYRSHSCVIDYRGQSHPCCPGSFPARILSRTIQVLTSQCGPHCGAIL